MLTFVKEKTTPEQAEAAERLMRRAIKDAGYVLRDASLETPDWEEKAQERLKALKELAYDLKRTRCIHSFLRAVTCCLCVTTLMLTTTRQPTHATEQ